MNQVVWIKFYLSIMIWITFCKTNTILDNRLWENWFLKKLHSSSFCSLIYYNGMVTILVVVTTMVIQFSPKIIQQVLEIGEFYLCGFTLSKLGLILIENWKSKYLEDPEYYRKFKLCNLPWNQNACISRTCCIWFISYPKVIKNEEIIHYHCSNHCSN